MYTLHKILFPIDFYHDETHALRHVRSLVEPRTAEAIFIHIVDEESRSARAAESKRDSAGWFDRLVEAGEAMGLRCRGEIHNGDAKQVVLEQAAQVGADCIAVSTGGRFAVDRLIERSLCMELIQESAVPVMAITPTMGPPRPQAADETLPRTIVCTVDQASGLDALHAALGIAKPIHATVIAVHPGGDVPDALRDEIGEVFNREEFRYIRGGVSRIRGLGTDDLVSAVRAIEAHLLVMPTAFEVEPGPLSSKTTAESVISLCDCPVLALPSVVHASPH